MATKSDKPSKTKDGLQEDGSYIPTERDFEAYRKETEYWVDKFGLYNYEWDIKCVEFEENDARAQCIINRQGCMAQSQLNGLAWEVPPNDGEIEQVAFHEVMEAMLAKMYMLGASRYINESEMETARHEVIRILENCVWKADFEGRSRKK